MALPTSGPLSLNDIAGEFGGATPHSLSEYYGAAAGIPTSGTISISDFYGASSGPSEIFTYGFYYGFQIIDVSNPASMSILSTTIDNTKIGYNPTGSWVNFSTNRMYLGTTGPYLSAWDTSNKASPSHLVNFTVNGYGGPATDSNDSWLYYGDYQYGSVEAWDISNISSPTKTGSYNSAPTNYIQRKVGGYVITVEAGTPAITSVTAASTPALASKVVISGANSPFQRKLAFDSTTNYFWWTNPWYYSDFLLYCDASNPASLSIGPQYSDGFFNQSSALAADNSILYIWMGGSKSLITYDVSSPNSPTQLGSLQETQVTGAQSGGMVKIGDTIFLADYSGGAVFAFDVSNPSSPSTISSLSGVTSPFFADV